MGGLVERARKEALLGNNVYTPWPQKLLNELADALDEARAQSAAKDAAITILKWRIIEERRAQLIAISGVT